MSGRLWGDHELMRTQTIKTTNNKQENLDYEVDKVFS